MRSLGFAAFVAFAVLAAPGRADDSGRDLEAQSTETRQEYERLKHQISLSDEKVRELEADIAALRKDNATLTAALIQAAKTEKKISEDIEDIEARLVVLRGREDAIRGSLKARRGVLAEVLGALQRMGLNPPPALLVEPEDALASVRSAILLGAVVPELRTETEKLATDLGALTRISGSIRDERDRLAERITEQAAEKERLGRLLVERKRIQAASVAAMEKEREKAATLVSRASNLEELIASLESEIETLKIARAKARRQEEDRRRREAELANRPVPKVNRLASSMSFDALRSKLPLPVAGSVVHRFGTPDSLGNPRSGDTVQTQSGAIVTAPADAIVLYSGPFRSYGQLLILDTGDGYHVVMAGLERINASLGQVLMAGEPVGAMGEVQLASAAGQGVGNGGPKLYIEFRKDGKPVDPAPWWAERKSGRIGNDS